jgi:hypothetical protein
LTAKAMLSGILAQAQPKPQSAASTILKLCDRLQNSTLLEDRRAAVLGLKGFSRGYREAVAAGGLRELILDLHKDAEDPDTCLAILETLIILFIPDNDSDAKGKFARTRHKKYPSPLLPLKKDGLIGPVDDISLWLTDEFTQKQENIFALIDLIKTSSEMYMKLYSLQLLSAIISNRPLRSQECIFSAPLGISTLVGCLDDPRDMIKNEAILVLIYLCNDHFDIQKVVAFEGAFDKTFKIINMEGGIIGGVVVEDALSLLFNLLRYNVSNQDHFRETNCTPKLANLLQINDAVDEQSAANLLMTLDICRLFVIEDHWATPGNQTVLCKSGILIKVLKLAFGPLTSLTIRSAALLTAADLVRSNETLQEEFLAFDVPYVDLSMAVNVERESQNIPVVAALLNWALLSTSIHTFDLRVAAQWCLNSALYGNDQAKLAFVTDQTELYKSGHGANGRHENGPSGTRAANLISALVDYDPDARLNPYKAWFAAVILIHIFEDSHDVRDFVRSLSIGDESAGEEVVSSIQGMSGMLGTSLQYPDPRISLGYLMLLSVWLYDDTKAVSDFLGESGTVQALISYTSHASSSNPLVEALATVLLGITYDFSSLESPVPR